MAILLPFLKPRHVVVPPQVAPGDRIYAIGDIRGHLEPLIRLLARISDDAAAFADGRQVRLVFLGNYIDGPHSAQVLETLMRLSDDAPDTAILLAGAREEALLRFIDDPEAGRDWLTTGGWDTLESYGIDPGALEDLGDLRDATLAAATDALDLIAGLRARYRSGDVFFCHAGVDPARPAEAQVRDTLIHGHPYGQGEMPLDGLRVVHGHHPAPDPVILPGRVCVDTDVAATGILTAIRLDDHEAILTSGPDESLRDRI